MKKHTTITMIAMAVAFNFEAFAQYPPSNGTQPAPKFDCTSKIAKMNYLMALRSENAGLAESSMMQAAEIKMLHPDADFAEIKNVTDSLATNGSTPSIRYKAYLASNVLDNPKWFAKKEHVPYETTDQFFASIAGQLQERLLGSRTN
ncbi:MAG TPA: hypothetical protein VMM58_13640 [Bacteroidota bacterium]|nr:hypothetical protein [Bacteroidota bacterium]